MGWSEDLLAAGLITEEEYETMSEIGSDIRHYGDVEALEDLFQMAYMYGLDELGDRLFAEYDCAIDFYESMYEYTIYYNPVDDRWHDSETHRYVKDPYEWVRD